MKNLLISTAVILTFTSAVSAMDLGAGVALDTEVVAAYTIDAEDMTTVITPTLSYSLAGATLSASTDLSVWNNGWVGNDTLDVKPTLDFEVSYFTTPALELNIATSYDLEADDGRDDITVSAIFNF